ncbi:MAG: DUF2007 domain-containing protein [Dehalococcoidales bacterium]|nr:DUF2007 domain-containing protein [Dehalococcoidales bacterium]
MSRTEKLVEVYRTVSEPEAQVIRSLLESFGIPCILRSNAAPSVHVFVFDGMGGVKIMVPEHIAGEARKLIEDRGEAGLPIGDGEPENDMPESED